MNNGKKNNCRFHAFCHTSHRVFRRRKPEVTTDEVTIVAPSSIGGGWDITARAIQDILMNKNLIDGDIRVINKIGAGGELGWKYTKQQKGHVLAINSSLLITNYLLSQSKHHLQGFYTTCYFGDRMGGRYRFEGFKHKPCKNLNGSTLKKPSRL